MKNSAPTMFVRTQINRKDSVRTQSKRTQSKKTGKKNAAQNTHSHILTFSHSHILGITKILIYIYIYIN